MKPINLGKVGFIQYHCYKFIKKRLMFCKKTQCKGIHTVGIH